MDLIIFGHLKKNQSMTKKWPKKTVWKILLLSNYYVFRVCGWWRKSFSDSGVCSEIVLTFCLLKEKSQFLDAYLKTLCVLSL